MRRQNYFLSEGGHLLTHIVNLADKNNNKEIQSYNVLKFCHGNVTKETQFELEVG